jgi:membrane associated rhomboid family serine protease
VHFLPGADPSQVVGEPVIVDPAGQPLPANAMQPGMSLRQRLIDRRSGDIVGVREIAVMSPMQEYGHFSTANGFLGLEVWRFVTFQFLHANITHLVLNMFGLWVFGGLVEQYLGGKRYAAFYLTCGIFGAISYLILNSLGNAFPNHRIPGVLPDSIFTPLIGASAGVFGVIMACAYIAPSAIVMLLFPPIPLKLKWLAYGYVGLAALNLFRGGQNAGGDAAHLGGAIAGAFFIRRAHLLRDFFAFRGGPGKGPGPRGTGTSQAELDRILAKVGQQGLKSLTPEERSALQRASDGLRG